MTDNELPDTSGATDESPAAQPKRYRAFISYSHSDNREQGRKWADWLHHSLETYQIPAELIGKPNAHGQPIPAQIFPVFQDEKELSANSDLSASLKEALDHSDFLVFLASPRSARSDYVQEELRHFKRNGKGKQIIAMILRGEPAYDGVQSDDQCFPAVLRHAVDEQGQIIESQADEALAADVRLPHSRDEGFTSSEAYRQHLQAQKLPAGEIKQRVQQYEERLNLAKLKIIATILGVSLADLTKRDQAYQIERMRRRHRIVVGVAVGMGGLAVAAAFAGVMAWQQKNRAQQNFALTLYTSGLNRLAQNEYGDPAAYIAASVRQGNANATAFAESMLATKEDLTPLPNMSPADLAFSPDGHYLAGRARIGTSTLRMQIWDVRTHKLVADLKQLDMQQGIGKPYFDRDNRLYFTDDKFRVVRYDMATGEHEFMVPNQAAERLVLQGVSVDGKWLGLRQLGTNLQIVRAGQPGAKASVPANLSQVVQLDFAPDGSAATLCAEREDKKGECLIVKLGNPDAVETRTVRIGFASPKVSFAEGGEKLVFWRGSNIELWDGGDPRPLSTGGSIYQWVAFNPGANTLLGMGDSTTDVYRLPNGEREESHKLPLGALKTVLPDNYASEMRSPDQAHSVVTRNARAFLYQQGPTPQLVNQLTFAADTRRIASDPNGKYLYAVRKDSGVVSRTNIATRETQADFIREPETITSLNTLRSGVVATTSGKYTTRLYDAETGKQIGSAISTRSLPIFSADEKLMTGRMSADSMGIWQVTDGKLLKEWKPTEGELPPYALDPSFKRMALSDGKGLRVIDLETRKPLFEDKEQPSFGRFSTDGQWMATSNKDGRLSVWNLASAKKALDVQSIASPMLRFSPDGKTMVVSEDARRMRLWNLESGQSVGQVIPVTANAQWTEFSQDGQRLFVQDNVTGSLTPSVKVIDSHNGNLISMPFARVLPNELMLSSNEQQLVTVTTAVDAIQAQIWQVPGSMRMPPEQLASDLESFYGRKYDMETGAIQSFDRAETHSSWFFADPYTRTLTPTSSVTVAADIARQLPLASTAQMQSLAAIYLYHPLARAGIAEYLARQGKLGAMSLQLASATQMQLDNESARLGANSSVATATRDWLAKTREHLGMPESAR
ncbi:toll/interleukin-1 receptor domain-containing protein [Diaphorobacter aerolatus]|uniref:Toll/interleukin-1 receptor domain-containing protein n=1 Tax=Diaphorobacter aerolatus TaxID=1288495 RepID=A0A7H0GG21_9BURK|nr:toll/interleukin-1 receptor domain-containing protein [Diaphorobacter aerolatus]QNP47237.1 toll/interleukin-1 receptor domain-containing protein [Diaphorobacter aerolatus]